MHCSLVPLTLGALLLATAHTTAQTVRVFPGDHAQVEGSSYSSSGFPFAFGVSRSLAIYSRQFLGLPNGASIRRIGVRPDATASVPGRRIRLEVHMGHSAVEVVNASSSFLSNYQGASTVVFTPKFVQLPALTPSSPGPSRSYVWIDLDTPFTYDASRNLIVDFRVSGNDNGNQAFSYPLDLASWISPRTTFGSSCAHSNLAVPTLNTTGGYVNGSWSINLASSLATTPYALHVGSGNSSWLGIPLPYSLSGAGAPGCSLLAEFPVVLNGTTSFSGTASIYAPVPNDLQFYGLTFYAQMLLLDFFANNLGVVTTNGVSTTFGCEPQMTHITATGNLNATFGGIYAYDGTVCVFQHQ